jgi:hypothetical protein
MAEFVAETCSWIHVLINYLTPNTKWCLTSYCTHFTFDLFDKQRGWRTSKNEYNFFLCPWHYWTLLDCVYSTVRYCIMFLVGFDRVWYKFAKISRIKTFRFPYYNCVAFFFALPKRCQRSWTWDNTVSFTQPTLSRPLHRGYSSADTKYPLVRAWSCWKFQNLCLYIYSVKFTDVTIIRVNL